MLGLLANFMGDCKLLKKWRATLLHGKVRQQEYICPGRTNISKIQNKIKKLEKQIDSYYNQKLKFLS